MHERAGPYWPMERQALRLCDLDCTVKHSYVQYQVAKTGLKMFFSSFQFCCIHTDFIVCRGHGFIFAFTFDFLSWFFLVRWFLEAWPCYCKRPESNIGHLTKVEKTHIAGNSVPLATTFLWPLLVSSFTRLESITWSFGSHFNQHWQGLRKNIFLLWQLLPITAGHCCSRYFDGRWRRLMLLEAEG